MDGALRRKEKKKMFLSQLKYNQKKFFLNLANHLLNIDGEFDEFESDYLRAICAEMSLSNNDVEDFKMENLNELFKESEEKKILLTEAIALALCNEEFDDKEKSFIEDLAQRLNLTSDVQNIVKMVKNHFENQKNMVSYIFSEE